MYEMTPYLIDLLKLRADVLLLPQSLTRAPVRRREDEFVWPRNAGTEMHSY